MSRKFRQDLGLTAKGRKADDPAPATGSAAFPPRIVTRWPNTVYILARASGLSAAGAGRELIGNIRDAHLWNVSQRSNESMKRLTILSVILLPQMFITGFFGKNFEGLPFDHRSLMLLMLQMLGGCVTVTTMISAYFVRSKGL